MSPPRRALRGRGQEQGRERSLRGKPGCSRALSWSIPYSLLLSGSLVLASGAILQAWSNPVWWRVSLPAAGNWNERSSEVSPNPNRSRILWLSGFWDSLLAAPCSCAPTQHNPEHREHIPFSQHCAAALRMEWSTHGLGHQRQHQTSYERLPKNPSNRN